MLLYMNTNASQTFDGGIIYVAQFQASGFDLRGEVPYIL
jgi:hypothetical protein